MGLILHRPEKGRENARFPEPKKAGGMFVTGKLL